MYATSGIGIELFNKGFLRYQIQRIRNKSITVPATGGVIALLRQISSGWFKIVIVAIISLVVRLLVIPAVDRRYEVGIQEHLLPNN